MPVAHDALLVAECLLERLSQCDTDILDRVVVVYVQVAAGADFEIEGTVPRDLFQHVLEKRDTGVEGGIALAIEFQFHRNPGFQRIAADVCTALWHLSPCSGEFRPADNNRHPGQIRPLIDGAQSRMKVTGPSLTRITCISAPKRPPATGSCTERA